MFIRQVAAAPTERVWVVVAALILALATVPMLASPLAAQESSAAPEVESSPTPTSAEAACSSADDLRFIVDFLRDSVESEAGLVPIAVGTIAALSEGRQLASLVGDTYRPLVDDVVVSLQDLRTTIGELGDLETAGAQIASIGEAITDIGDAMDELAMQLRGPCPSDA